MAGFRGLPTRARVLVVAMITLGAAGLLAANLLQPIQPNGRAVLFVLLAGLAGLVKVPLPVGGSLSLGYSFVLATLMGFGLGPSTLAGLMTALSSGLVSSNPKARPEAHQTAFNAGLVCATSLAAGLGYLASGGGVGTLRIHSDLVGVVVYTVVFATMNVGSISLILHWTDGDTVGPSLLTNLRWSIPGYVAGSSLAVLLNILLSEGSPMLLLLAAPFVYLVHLAYRARTEKVEEEKRYSEQAAEVYRGITEALALAIEAKDENTEEHLERVEQYCLGISEILALPQEEVEALRSAALLHDVGKICVPDHILTKPGRLTAEEFEIMKIHPVVGADILGAVPFPYPLTPIVRHHHERWDGSGYPDGLAGESIPLGARILTVVDCYDALISDRPYRKGTTREEALDFLHREAGRMFDPEIVRVLSQNADVLEARMRRSPRARCQARLPRFLEIAREDEQMPDPDLVRRLESLGDLTMPGETSRNRGPMIELLVARIATVIPFRTLVIYVAEGETLVARFATGHAEHKIRGHEIRIGELLSGWAMYHQRPAAALAHRNPMERDGARFDLESLQEDPEVAELRASLVCPMATDDRRVGVIALYHDANHPFEGSQIALLGIAARHLANAVLFEASAGTGPESAFCEA